MDQLVTSQIQDHLSKAVELAQSIQGKGFVGPGTRDLYEVYIRQLQQALDEETYLL